LIELLNGNQSIFLETGSGYAEVQGEQSGTPTWISILTSLEYKGVKTEKKWNKMQDEVDELQDKWFKLTSSLVSLNPFKELGAYPKVAKKYFNSYPDGKPFYEDPMYGLKKNPGYCAMVDFYNLEHPENIFEQMNFFTDYCDDEGIDV
jgi:hypothetical protein